MRHTFPQPDLFIAATAILHDLCVVTRNVDDFVRAGVPLLNPWTDTIHDSPTEQYGAGPSRG
jgi:toxin FitB